MAPVVAGLSSTSAKGSVKMPKYTTRVSIQMKTKVMLYRLVRTHSDQYMQNLITAKLQ
jgi:hypothetical protein